MPVKGGRNTVGGSIQETDDKSGAFLPREAAGLVSVHRVRSGDISRISDGPHIDAEWEVSVWEMVLLNHGPW